MTLTGWADINYAKGTFDRLTQTERAKNPETGSWGGRRTVGGSPWNTPSCLTVEEIVALLNYSESPCNREGDPPGRPY